MKKLLLSLAACFAMVGTVSAETLTILPADLPTNEAQGYKSFEITAGGTSFQVNNAYGNGTAQIRVNQTGNTGFELYNTTAITGIQSVVLNVEGATGLGTWYMTTSNSASISESATSDAAGAIQGTVNGTSSVTFTVPTSTEASFFHFNLTAKGGGTVKLTSVVITYEAQAGGGDAEPETAVWLSVSQSTPWAWSTGNTNANRNIRMTYDAASGTFNAGTYLACHNSIMEPGILEDGRQGFRLGRAFKCYTTDLSATPTTKPSMYLEIGNNEYGGVPPVFTSMTEVLDYTYTEGTTEGGMAWQFGNNSDGSASFPAGSEAAANQYAMVYVQIDLKNKTGKLSLTPFIKDEEEPDPQGNSVTFNFTGVEDAYKYVTAFNTQDEENPMVTFDAATSTFEYPAGGTALIFSASNGYEIEITCPETSVGGQNYLISQDMGYTLQLWDGANGYTFTVNVTEPKEEPEPGTGGEATAAFYATASYTGDAQYSAKIVNGSGDNLVNPVVTTTAGDVSFYLEKVNNSASNVNGNQVRWYQNDVMHITPANGATITKIVIDEVSNYNKSATPSTGSVSLEGNTLTWTGSTQGELTLSAVAQIRFTLMTVTYTTGTPSAVSTPVISCEKNQVTITCATDDAEIYYTTDGTEPSNASNKYSTPFAITANTTVKAIAYVGSESSAVATYNAVYEGTYDGFEALVAGGSGTEGTVNGPITAIYQNGQYLYVVDSKNYPMLVYGSTNNTYENGDQIYEISGKYSPYNNLPELTNPVFGTKSAGTAVNPIALTAAPTEAQVNQYVELANVSGISGSGQNYTAEFAGSTIALYSRFNGVNIPTDDKTYTVTGFVSIFNTNIQIYPTSFEVVEDVNQVETPVITCAENTVTITCATDDATIYYTIDGEEPTTSSLKYDAPFEIEETLTVKAYAVKEGMNDSYVATSTCTFVDPNATEAQFDFTNPEGLTPAQERPENGQGIDIPNVTFTNGLVSFAVGESNGSNAPRLWAATGQQEGQVDLRLYKEENFTITIDGDNHITQIVFTKAGGNFDMTPSTGTLEKDGNTATWLPDAQDATVSSVEFDATATTRISTVTVYYDTNSTNGVDSVEAADDSEAVYYNLQGVRVANPDRGIYIKVTGNKAVKVVK